MSKYRHGVDNLGVEAQFFGGNYDSFTPCVSFFILFYFIFSIVKSNATNNVLLSVYIHLHESEM